MLQSLNFVSNFDLSSSQYSWHMSPIHGTGADNAIAITAITADGDVIEATIDNDHSDLRYGMAGTVSNILRLHASKPFALVLNPWFYLLSNLFRNIHTHREE